MGEQREMRIKASVACFIILNSSFSLVMRRSAVRSIAWLGLGPATCGDEQDGKSDDTSDDGYDDKPRERKMWT